MKKIMKNKLGFTFIEVIVAVVIMAIMGAVLAPTLIQYMEESRISSDLQTGEALVSSVNNALSDPSVLDEVYHYSVSNNFITYSDSSGTYASQVNDEEYWAPDGQGWATTITFNPAIDGSAQYVLTEAIVNDMTYNNGSIVSPARVLENCDAYIASCYIHQMTTDDTTVSAKLYSALAKDFDNTIKLQSKTYNQSSFTVFVKFDILGDQLTADVYGSFNGTNLDPTCKAALGTGTTEVVETPQGSQGNGTQSGTTDAIFDFSALAGGGISSNNGSTGAINNIKPAATNAVMDKNKFLAFCQAAPNKNQIQNIKFVAAGSREDTTDVSVNGDGSVVAWVEGLDICVSAKNNNAKFYAPVDSSNLFNVDYTGLPNIVNISTIYGDMSKTTSASSMFKGNTTLISIDMTGQSLQVCKDMSYMFSGCSNLKTLRMPDTKTNNVENMSGLFENCARLSTFPYHFWNTSKVTNMSSMFKGCSRLQAISVSNLEVNAVVDFGHMFEGCSRLKSLDLSAWGVQIDNGRIFTAMFKDCLALQSIDFSRWEISGEVTNLGEMFASCKALKEIDTAALFVNGTSKCVDFNRMFYDCAQIQTLDLGKFNTSKAADMDAMFDNMVRLQTIRLGGAFAFSGNGNTRCYLPEPSNLYIPGANGTWNNQVGNSYYPREVPSRRDDTYSAVSLVKPAILAPRATWWKSETTSPSSITRIVIANSFTGGTYTEKWNADVENSGSLEVYVNGNIAYIVNNKNKMAANAFMLSEDASGMFADFINLTTIDGAKLINTVNVANMNYFFAKFDDTTGTFQSCSKLTSVKDIEQWNIANVKYADYMFAGTAFTSLNLSQWQVPNISSAERMFYKTKLTALDLTGWDLSSAVNLAGMFEEATKLQELKANDMKVNKSVTPTNMFKNCTALTTIHATSDFDLSESKPIVNMFEGCINLKGNSGTTYAADKITNEQAHIDNGSSGYFTGVNRTTGTITARIYEQGLATGTSQVLTTSGIDVKWDYTKNMKLVEIKLSSLPRNREKILTVKVPMGMYIVADSWTKVNDDVSNVVFTPYDIDATKNGLQQGTGAYTNSQTGTLTYTIAPYVKDTTITLKVMFDTTLWDKHKGNISNRGTTYTIDNQYKYLTKEDALVLTLDEVEIKKIKNVESTNFISNAVATDGWAYNFSIWQQNKNMYINDTGATTAPYNGNYIDIRDRSTQNMYFKSVDYEVWCQQTAPDGSIIYARWTDTKPNGSSVGFNTMNATYSTNSTNTVYKAHWDNAYSTNVAFPCIIFHMLETDGFRPGTVSICYKVQLETFAGRKFTLTQTQSYNLIENSANFSSLTLSKQNFTTLPESYYSIANAKSYMGSFLLQNEKLADIKDVKAHVLFDKDSTIGELPKLKVSYFVAPTCASQTIDYKILLINDSGNPAGPFTYSATSSTSSHAAGTKLYAQKIASANNLTGTWYLKEIEYVIPVVKGGYQRTYLYGSGSNLYYDYGGSILGVASAQAQSTMTVSELNGTKSTSATVTTYVEAASMENSNKTTFSGRIQSVTANSSVNAGEALDVKLRLQSCNYPQWTSTTNRASSVLFTRPVVYLTLPDGISIDPSSIIIHNSGNTTNLATAILTYVKSVEKSGALYNIYKISFDSDTPFGYFTVGTSVGSITSAVKDISFRITIDSAMPSCSINWQNCLLFTDAYGSINNGSSSARYAANMFADVDDVDGDGNTSEKFASIGESKTLTIN